MQMIESAIKFQYTLFSRGKWATEKLPTRYVPLVYHPLIVKLLIYMVQGVLKLNLKHKLYILSRRQKKETNFPFPPPPPLHSSIPTPTYLSLMKVFQYSNLLCLHF